MGSVDSIPTGLLSIIMASSFHCATCSEYFPPPESEGGWRKNIEPDFVRSLGVDPVKLEEFGQYMYQQQLLTPSAELYEQLHLYKREAERTAMFLALIPSVENEYSAKDQHHCERAADQLDRQNNELRDLLRLELIRLDQEL